MRRHIRGKPALLYDRTGARIMSTVDARIAVMTVICGQTPPMRPMSSLEWLLAKELPEETDILPELLGEA
jgi:hypothetical protein